MRYEINFGRPQKPGATFCLAYFCICKGSLRRILWLSGGRTCNLFARYNLSLTFGPPRRGFVSASPKLCFLITANDKSNLIAIFLYFIRGFRPSHKCFHRIRLLSQICNDKNFTIT